VDHIGDLVDRGVGRNTIDALPPTMKTPRIKYRTFSALLES
jgi:hypothetical protein